MPRCSIIIPVYNRSALTRQCLDSLIQQPPWDGEFEIIVVDDGSSDDTPRLLDGYGDRIHIIRHAVNTGFSTACNDGAAAAAGDHLVFLNNDTQPASRWLNALVDYADRHERAAVVGSKLLYPNNTVQHVGVVIIQDGWPRHLYAGFPGDHPAVNQSRRFQIVTGACALVRRGPFEEVGGFDTVFVNGIEDVDLCLRLGRRGHEVHYCHESVLYHLESVSEGRFARERSNQQRYRHRWLGRVRPDDVDYYLADGLLTLAYPPGSPIECRISPLLGTVAEPGRERPVDQVLHRRGPHLYALLRENAGLTLQLQERRGELLLDASALGSRPHGDHPAALEALVEPMEELRPPPELIFVGGGDFREVGELLLGYLIDRGGLRPSDAVLDVGCGIGRVAIPLTRYLDAEGCYEGFDIRPSAITWCQEQITPRFPRFTFRLADIYNGTYNPDGTGEAATFAFPYADRTFDFVFLTSVFTHMLPREIEHYLREIARVLKVGGRCLITFFLLNDEARELMRTEAAYFNFEHDRGVYHVLDPTGPEGAVAFEEAYIRALFGACALEIQEPPFYGTWCGRESPTVMQDIVVAIKRAPSADDR